MYLWLDDMRDPRDHIDPFDEDKWVWAKNFDEAREAIEQHDITFASLDHDLAAEHYPFLDPPVPESEYTEKTGYDFVKWLVEHDLWPTDGIHIHSANTVGAGNMSKTVARYGPYRLLNHRLFLREGATHPFS